MNPLIQELIDYTVHDSTCILAHCSAGRPTSTGYECLYGNTWYEVRPIDRTPLCECGLNNLIQELINEQH
jgi:hypothetical protein